MTFSTDEYFHIGQMHLIKGKPCQDYAFSSVYGSVGFAVVSDGCSKGRYTDIGSRVIALSTASAVKQYASINHGNFANGQKLRENIKLHQESLVRLTRESLDLELDDMIATCGYACLSPAGGFVHLRGDGAIAVVEKNGDINLSSYQWNNNTPLYPAYAEDDYQGFINYHGGDPSRPALKIENWKFIAGKLSKEGEDLVSISEGINGAFRQFSAEEIQKISFVAVFTDGVMQMGNIVSGEDGFMDWKEVVLQLMSFKNLAGEFAKRRIIRFLKDNHKNGEMPLDDIAYAVVRVNMEGS